MGDLDYDERAWTAEQFMADCDAIIANPPAAPDGCDAQPRHWPTYVAYVDGQYPAPCMYCVSAHQSETINRARCEKDHRHWKSWNVWSRLASRLYVLGITASGGGTSFGRCEFCGIGRQHMAPIWRGRRVYILGKYREWWSCLIRRHHFWSPSPSCGLCTICAPCSECGSTERTHIDGWDCPDSGATGPVGGGLDG